MNSYIDIFLNYKGMKYPAKLYGNKLVSEMCHLELSPGDITGYKVNIFRRKIRLFFNHDMVLVDYHDMIIRWFDPLYKIRLFIIGSFMALPPLTVFAISGVKFELSRFFPVLLVSFGISIISGLLGTYFFRLVRLGKENLYVKILLLLLVMSVPVMYWYPFSVYIFAAGAALFIIFLFAQYIFSSAFNVFKYYLSLSWVLMMIFLYFWIISILKLSIDYNMYHSANGVIRESQDQSVYTYGNISWEKPMDWKITKYNFLQTILKRRQLLWQFSPLPVQKKISTPESPEFGWMAVSKQAPSQVLVQINNYLEVQKNMLLAEVLEKSPPFEESTKAGQIIIQSFSYYDMIERKVSSIYILAIPVIDEENDISPSTMIFTFKIPQSASVNYYLDLIRGGIKRDTKSN